MSRGLCFFYPSPLLMLAAVALFGVGSRIHLATVAFHTRGALYARARLSFSICSHGPGYEAAMPPEKPSITVADLSKKVVKAILQHDIDLLEKKRWNCDNRDPHLAQRWRLRRHPKRLSPRFYGVGEKVKGRVAVTFPSYALVDVGATCYGVLHARDMSREFIDRVDLFLRSGDDLVVFIKSHDPNQRFLNLSLLDFTVESHGAKPRLPVDAYEVEQIVSGVIVRRSAFGYYIDIGATVDAFLHSNDRKLPRSYTGVQRKSLFVGSKVEGLYIKNVDVIRNRISLSENSYAEELDKRALLGDDTLEKQAGYTFDVSRDYSREMFARDLEMMGQTGALDDYLATIGGDRNTNLHQLFYLDTQHKIRQLEQQQEELMKRNPKTKAEMTWVQDKFNECTSEISRLDEACYEPEDYAKSVYNYDESESVAWQPKSYTPFNANNTGEYFETVGNELKGALQDVQGENFNFASLFQTAPDNLKSRLELVDFLYDEFHKPPSSKSNIPDKVNRSKRIDDYDDLAIDDKDCVGTKKYTFDEVVAKLKSFNEPDADNILKMIEDTKGFNPTKYSPRFIDSDASAIRGASAMLKDDVTTFDKRAAFYARNSTSYQQIAATSADFLQGQQRVSDANATGGDDNLPGAPAHVIEALEGYDANFVEPEIAEDVGDFHTDKYGNLFPEHEHESTSLGLADGVATDSVAKSLQDTEVTTGLRRSNEGQEILKDEDLDMPIIYRRYLGVDKSTGNNTSASKKATPTCSFTNELPAATVPSGPFEPTVDYMSLETGPEDPIKAIINDVRASTATDDPSLVDAAQDPENYKPRRLSASSRPCLSHVLKYMDPMLGSYLLGHAARNSSETSNKKTTLGKDSTPLMPAAGHLETGSLATFGKDENDEVAQGTVPQVANDSKETISKAEMREIHSAVGTLMVDEKRGLKKVAKIATKHLDDKELKIIEALDKTNESAEEYARLLRPPRPPPKVEYNPEGWVDYKPPHELYSDNRKMHEARIKLRALCRNRRFIAMLQRLGIRTRPTIANVATLFPRSLIRRRNIPKPTDGD